MQLRNRKEKGIEKKIYRARIILFIPKHHQLLLNLTKAKAKFNKSRDCFTNLFFDGSPLDYSVMVPKFANIQHIRTFINITHINYNYFAQIMVHCPTEP